MRRLLFILPFILHVACSSSTNSNFVVYGTINNAQDGEMICLSYPIEHDGIWYEQCDTTYIHGGRFRFDGNVDGLVPAGLSFQNMDFAQLFIEPSEIQFSAERNALYDYSISGLSVAKELHEYREAFAEYDKAIYEKCYEVMRKSEAWAKAYDANSPDADSLWTEFCASLLEHHAISAGWQDLALEFVCSHPHNALVPNVIDGLISCGCGKHVVDSLISTLSTEQRQSVLGELMTIRRAISALDGGKVGSKALDFTLSSANGASVTLSECYAKGYVLLDFWASWCRPCINEIPNVRELHDKYGDRMQIVSISVDSDTTKWREAVAQHNLTSWPQLIVERPDDAEKYYFREQADISMAYDVQEIPCFMLVDTTGVIVGRWTHITPSTIAEIERLIGADK